MNNYYLSNVSNMNMEKIYRQIAKNNKVSVEEVKNEMRLAVNAMWKKQTPQAKKLFPNGKPTLDEFLITLYKDIKTKND